MRMQLDNTRPNCLWRDCGYPPSGVVHQIKCKAKRRYKYDIRRLKRRQQYLMRTKLGSALYQARSKDFWKEVHKLKKTSSSAAFTSVSVDGVTNSSDVANLFSTKISHLLNSSKSGNLNILNELNNSITDKMLSDVHVTPIVVREALSHLKSGKRDGSPLTSDHFLLAGDAIVPFLSSLFTVMFRHGHVSPAISDCLLRPSLKPDKNPEASDSYRPIALAPTLSKVLEWCILILYSDTLVTSGLQFGFKKGHSTTLCSGLLKSVASYYVSKGSPVFKKK